MTFAPCLEHQPMHSFIRGWVCAICGAAVTPKPLVTAEWVTQKSALEGDSDPTTGLPMTQDYTALENSTKGWKCCGCSKVSPDGKKPCECVTICAYSPTETGSRWWDDCNPYEDARDATIANLQLELNETREEVTRRGMEIMGRGEALTIAEAEAATLRARLEALAQKYEKSWGYDDDLRKSAGMQTTGQVFAAAIRAALEADHAE